MSQNRRSDSLDALREQTQQITQAASPVVRSGGRSCEIIARLDEIVEQHPGQHLVLRATALFDGPYTAAGQPETYVVRPQAVLACQDNLKKGVGSAPGSILVFGGAWRDHQTQHMSIGWINTAISAQKKKAGMNGHESRSIQQVYASMPYLDFPNVTRQAGEPTHIRWGMTLDSAHLPVESAPGQRALQEFPREWLCAKLQAAWEKRTVDAVKINQWLPTFNVEAATVCRDEKALQEAVMAMLDENPYRRLLARVSDDQTVETTYLPFKGKDSTTHDYAEKLLAQVPGFDAQGDPVFHPDTGEQVMVDRYSLVQGIDNHLLLGQVEAGHLRLELLPRENILLSTKNAPGMANDINRILSLASNQELHTLNMAFGADPRAVSRVALVVQPHEDKRFIVGGPFRLDSGPAYTLKSLPSPLTAPLHEATPAPVHATPPSDDRPLAEGRTRHTPTPSSPAESTGNESGAPAFPDVDEDFDLDPDAAIDSALDEPPPAQPDAAQSEAMEPARGTPGNYDPERDPLLTDEQRRRMLTYGAMSAKGEHIDPKPVVKLFTPDAQCTWLLTELDPREPDIAFGLCDLGQGTPELGSVSLTEISQARGPLKLKIERDLHFEAQGPLSAYAKAARAAGQIVENIAEYLPKKREATPARLKAPVPQL